MPLRPNPQVTSHPPEHTRYSIINLFVRASMRAGLAVGTRCSHQGAALHQSFRGTYMHLPTPHILTRFQLSDTVIHRPLQQGCKQQRSQRANSKASGTTHWQAQHPVIQLDSHVLLLDHCLLPLDGSNTQLGNPRAAPLKHVRSALISKPSYRTGPLLTGLGSRHSSTRDTTPGEVQKCALHGHPICPTFQPYPRQRQTHLASCAAAQSLQTTTVWAPNSPTIQPTLDSAKLILPHLKVQSHSNDHCLV